MRLKLAAVLALTLSLGAQAAPPPDMTPTGRTGLGQDAPTDGAVLRNLRLDHPLVQKKYLQDADLLRFLRATYSEACVRGMLAKALSTILRNEKASGTAGENEVASKLTQGNRIWKISSFEMEMLLGPAYLKTANYCDCVMKEVAEVDLVSPAKGIEVVEKIPTATLKTCERIAEEKTEQQTSRKK